jgi:hypothetical protein
MSARQIDKASFSLPADGIRLFPQMPSARRSGQRKSGKREIFGFVCILRDSAAPSAGFV